MNPIIEKLKVRIRKRENLPVNSKYRDPKYDHAFASKIMSDDEDQFDASGKKTGLYVSYLPLYRSQDICAPIYPTDHF
jgi:hypothetical protein